jgi:hypothetical protein
MSAHSGSPRFFSAAGRPPGLVLAAWLSLALLAAGCASSSSGLREKPDWVDGPAARYPAGEFLLGRGSAETVDQAQERARADLAKVFEVAIAAESSDRQSSQGEGGSMRYESAVEQRIVSRTDQVISGMRIAELWTAPPATKGGAGRPHALAVLPRGPAALALRQEITRRDEAISRQVERARVIADPLDRAGVAGHAVDLARQRAGFEQHLRVLDLGGRGVETAYGLSRLEADFAAQLKRLVLAPTLAASGLFGEPSLMPLLRGAIVHAGFVTPEAGAEGAAYGLKVTTRLDEEDLQGWHWVRGNITVTLVDPAGRVRGSQAWPVKASAQEQPAARARTLLEIERLLKQELRPAVLAFAAS